MRLMFYMLAAVWVIIDLEILIFICLKNKEELTQINISQRHIEGTKKMFYIIADNMTNLVFFLMTCVIVGAVINIDYNKSIDVFVNWYAQIFIVSLLPIFISVINGQNLIKYNTWIKIFFGIILVSGFIVTCINREDQNVILDSLVLRYMTISVVAIFITSFLLSCIFLVKESYLYYKKRNLNKGFREDLLFRTPRLKINTQGIELSIICEKLHDEYMYRYKKIEGLHTIEYVNLTGVYRNRWYRKVAHIINIFVVISILSSIIISVMIHKLYPVILVAVLILLFEILVYGLKCVKINYLFNLAIVLFLDKWGYYVRYNNKEKFVGNIQILSNSKIHKYIHSFLDIVALCRAVSSCYEKDREEKIVVIARELSDLFMKYTDYEKEKNWVMIIPLWSAALFEFYVTGRVDNDVKNTLLISVNEKVRIDISMFLQSFWLDIERKKVECGITDLVQSFENEIYK